MSIFYTLQENHLTSDPNDYLARVQPTSTADLDQVVEQMLKSGSTVTKADILSVLEDYFSAIETLLLAGMNVNTPHANYRVSIKGTFNGASDSYDPARHQVDASLSPGARLRDVTRKNAQLVKQAAVAPPPQPLEYNDINTDSRNAILTPGGLGQVVGHRLKFDSADPAQGIFLMTEAGDTVRVETVGRNKPAELMFIVPPTLAAGDYILEVRAISSGTTDLRKGQLRHPLTVS